MIAVIDYGMGNLRSVSKALEYLGGSVRVTGDPEVVEQAEKLVLPGVGAFPAAMRELAAQRLIDPVKRAITARKPYLGICLGLQLLFDSGEEDGGAKGFGILPGQVKRLPVAPPMKIPHMGWNQVSGVRSECPLLHDIAEGSFFYFVHSYYAQPSDASVTASETDYGVRFASMVWHDRLFATQFHPEKSQAVGLQMLENFLKL